MLYSLEVKKCIAAHFSNYLMIFKKNKGDKIIKDQNQQTASFLKDCSCFKSELMKKKVDYFKNQVSFGSFIMFKDILTFVLANNIVKFLSFPTHSTDQLFNSAPKHILEGQNIMFYTDSLKKPTWTSLNDEESFKLKGKSEKFQSKKIKALYEETIKQQMFLKSSQQQNNFERTQKSSTHRELLSHLTNNKSERIQQISVKSETAPKSKRHLLEEKMEKTSRI